MRALMSHFGDCKCAETLAQLRHLSAAAAALTIAGSSATEAFAARTSYLLCCGLLSCEVAVPESDRGSRMQQRCSARHRLFAQLRHQSAAAAALAIAGLSATGAFAVCISGAACFRAQLRCLNAIKMHGCRHTVQRGTGSLYSCVTGARLRRRWQLPNQARPRLLPRARAVCSAAACFRAALWCVCAIVMRGCSNAARWGV